MTPRALLRIAPFLLLPITVAPLAAQNPTGRAWCSSNSGDSVVYSTPVFDDKMKAGSAYRSSFMGYEFTQYLIGHYDLARKGPFAAACGSFQTETLAETQRQTTELQVTSAGRKVVSVPWNYVPDSAEVEFSFAAQRSDGGSPEMPRLPNNRAYCVTDTYAQPLYTSAIFPVSPDSVNLAAWQIAWMKFLSGKYGYKGDVYCNTEGRGWVPRVFAARVQGAKDAGRKVIATEWKYGAPAPAAAKPDDDPEPKAAPAPPAPSAQLRDQVTKDANDALMFCQNDRMLNGALDCNMVQRTVYNYLIAHPASAGQPVAGLLSNDRLDCRNCLSQFVTEWARSRAQSNGYSPTKSTCVAPKFVAALQARPYVNRVKELFDAAMKACPR
ncbi:MAG TPA: hypothetical protein VFU23_12885 [Gemmatimonadales bacterium]|nr:hypothetical protein [Gemmatimonadales bacterium]